MNQTTSQVTIWSFAAQFRASDKPFIAHLVGCASILAFHRERTDMIVRPPTGSA